MLCDGGGSRSRLMDKADGARAIGEATHAALRHHPPDLRR